MDVIIYHGQNQKKKKNNVKRQEICLFILHKLKFYVKHGTIYALLGGQQ